MSRLTDATNGREKTVGDESRFIKGRDRRAGVGFQLNMIDEETFVSVEFPGGAEGRSTKRDAPGAINIFARYLFARRARRAVHFSTRAPDTGCSRPGVSLQAPFNVGCVREI